MAESTKKKKVPKPLTEHDLYKIKVAEDLGLGEKLRQEGWGGLTAKETGRIGAVIGMKRKAEKQISN